MKTKFISILLVVMLVMNLIPFSFVHAADPSYTFTVTADKTTAKKGEEITYTISVSGTAPITSLQIQPDVPAGLTLVSGSETYNEDLKNAIVGSMPADDILVNMFGYLSIATPFDINGRTYGTFKCTVDDSATGEYTVGVKGIVVGDENSDRVDNANITVQSTKTTVVVPVTGITLNETTLALTSSSSKQLVATVAPATATNKTVNWTSSNAEVASVDASGNVTAKKEGTATITAKTADGNFTATCAVTVTCAHTNKTTHPAVTSTCLVQGNAEYETCDACGKVVSGSDAKLPLGPHNYGNLIPEVGAIHTPDTLQEGTLEHYKCSVCNKLFDKNKVEVSAADLVIKAPEHTYAGDWVATDSTQVPNSNATVDTNAYHWKNCGCGNIIQEAHKGGEATCTNKAECEVCSAEYGNLDSTNHKNTELRNELEETCTTDGYTGDKYCKDCNTKLETGKVIPAAHKGGEATCIAKAVCEVCSQEYGDTDPDNHKDVELKDKKDATCTEDGYTGDKFCNDCNTEFEKGKVIKAGHKGGKATCVKKAVCEVCKKEYGVVDATNHVNTTIKGKKDATKDKEGYTGDEYCKDCKKVVKKGTVIAKLKDDSNPVTPGVDGGNPVGGGTPASDNASAPAPSGVQTGDNSNIILWVCLLAVSGIGFIVVRKCQKENNNKINRKTLILIIVLIIAIIAVIAIISFISLNKKDDKSVMGNDVTNTISSDESEDKSNVGSDSILNGTFSYDENVKYEFGNNGKGAMSDKTEKYEYTYTIDNNTLKIDFKDEMIFDATYTFELEGDTLVLTGGEGTNGGEYTLKKVK